MQDKGTMVAWLSAPTGSSANYDLYGRSLLRAATGACHTIWWSAFTIVPRTIRYPINTSSRKLR